MGRAIRVSPEGARVLREGGAESRQLLAAATDFRHFLPHWHFLDQERGEVRKLGAVLWPGQQKFARAMDLYAFIYSLKARKLGFTTIATAYDAWVMRFRDPFARVHLFSRREKAAQELLFGVKFGLVRLPNYMRLPTGSVDNATEFTMASSYVDETGEVVDELRRAVAYPADETTAVEATCNHGHVDEWARMRNPRKVWQAVEPTMAGTCHILTTSQGPQNYASEYWRRSIAGETKFHPFFVGALERPDRSEAEVMAIRKADFAHGVQEYPLTWEEAISGGGELVFDSNLLNVANEDCLGRAYAPVEGRKYLCVWDIGRHKDAAVGIVYDITDEVHDVVHYERHVGLPYPNLQKKIEKMHRTWKPLRTVIEKNAAGEAVMENLEISAHQVEGWHTGPASKARALQMLVNGFENETIKYDALEWPQLDGELRGYQLPDTNIIQDSVITLAIAEASAASVRRKKGRVLAVLNG